MSEYIKYDQIADIYDTFVRTQLDIPFFLNEASQTKGELLELMCGTGRVSVPLAEAGVRLTCVDRSSEMLTVLRNKLDRRKLSAKTLQMDVRELKLSQQYDLIIIPFHSFAELLSPEDQRKTLTQIYGLLSETGRFICTLHNPSVRLKSVDGNLKFLNKTNLDRDRTLITSIIQNFEPSKQIVTGLEFFEIYNDRGFLESKRMLEFNFHLLSKNDFQESIETIGFKVAALYGDYSYSPFQEKTSPFTIWILKKQGA